MWAHERRQRLVADGDSGVDKDGDAATRRVRDRKVAEGGGKGGDKGSKGGKRKRTNIVSLHGWEWDAKEEFEIEKLIGKMVVQEGVEIPGRGMPGTGEACNPRSAHQQP
eukprot:4284323-Prymnesium_polylepis.1